MRALTIRDRDVPVCDADAAQLVARGLAHECVDPDFGHDLHLNPEHAWTLADVEDLVAAAAYGKRELLDAARTARRRLPDQPRGGDPSVWDTGMIKTALDRAIKIAEGH